MCRDPVLDLVNDGLTKVPRTIRIRFPRTERIPKGYKYRVMVPRSCVVSPSSEISSSKEKFREHIDLEDYIPTNNSC